LDYKLSHLQLQAPLEKLSRTKLMIDQLLKESAQLRLLGFVLEVLVQEQAKHFPN
jgi:hypothetical protein